MEIFRTKIMNNTILWGALWRSDNMLDGKNRHLIYKDGLPHLFRTKKQCAAWIAQEFHYIRTRKDLRLEPYGWKMPIPIEVSITIE